MVGTTEEFPSRYSQLKFARDLLQMKEGRKKERLKNQFQKDALLTHGPWDMRDLLFLIKILYNNDKSIPLKTLKRIGTNNPRSLVRILINDVLKVQRSRQKSIIDTNLSSFVQGPKFFDE